MKPTDSGSGGPLWRFSLKLHAIVYLAMFLGGTISAGWDFFKLGYTAVFLEQSMLFNSLVFMAKLLAAYAATAAFMGSMTFGLCSAGGARRCGMVSRLLVAAILFCGQGIVFIHCLVIRPALYEEFLSTPGGVMFHVTRWCTATVNPAYTGCLLAVFTVVSLFGLGRWGVRNGLGDSQVRRRILIVVAVVFLAAGACTVPGLFKEWRSTAPPTGRPDIFFIAVDSLRADRLSGNGYHRPVTPHIDRLREQGVNCSLAFTNLARTAPAWASVITGAYPYRHGIYHSFSRPENLKLNIPTLSGELRKQGYWSFVAADYAGANFSSCDMDFDRVVAPPDYGIQVIVRVMILKKHAILLPYISNRVGTFVFPELVFVDSWSDAHMLNDTFESLLREAPPGRSLMGIIFYSNVHFPFSSPYPYYKLYADPGYYGRNQYAYEVKSLFDLTRVEQAPPEGEIQQIRNLYDGAVRYIDDAVGGLIAMLKRQGRYENSIIILLSDHGEQLFEYGSYIAHGKYLSGGDGAMRIPLVMRFPDGTGAGTRIRRLVRNIDIFPTIMDYLGATSPATVEGKSLLPLLAESGTRNESRIIYGETGIWFYTLKKYREDYYTYPVIYRMVDLMADTSRPLHLLREYETAVQQAKRRMVRDERFKLIYVPMKKGAVYRLYDMRADPGQQSDVAARYPEAAARLKNILLDHMRCIPGYTLDENEILQPRE